MVRQQCIFRQLCERMMHSQSERETQGKRKVKEFMEETGRIKVREDGHGEKCLLCRHPCEKKKKTTSQCHIISF